MRLATTEGSAAFGAVRQVGDQGPAAAGWVRGPVFAFFAAGVTVGGLTGLIESLTDTVALGIIVGLVADKAIGIFGATYLMARFTKATLDDDLRWVDVVGLAMLAGIGFTVSLLIGDLAYGAGSERDEHVKVGVLVGSVLAALLAAVILRLRNRTYRRLCAEEERDTDADGTPTSTRPPRPSPEVRKACAAENHQQLRPAYSDFWCAGKSGRRQSPDVGRHTMSRAHRLLGQCARPCPAAS